eukprot:Lankesteria_metandrocarpae@DN575_c0_g1_i1.p1
MKKMEAVVVAVHRYQRCTFLDSTKLLEALNVYHSDDVRHHSDDVRGVRDDANSCSQLKWHSSGDDQALSDDYDRRACDGDGTYNSYYSSDDGLAEYDIVIPNHELRQNSRVKKNEWTHASDEEVDLGEHPTNLTNTLMLGNSNPGGVVSITGDGALHVCSGVHCNANINVHDRNYAYTSKDGYDENSGMHINNCNTQHIVDRTNNHHRDNSRYRRRQHMSTPIGTPSIQTESDTYYRMYKSQTHSSESNGSSNGLPSTEHGSAECTGAEYTGAECTG